VSIEAIAWALNRAPIPPKRRDASSLAIVLVGLANHADPDGRNAFPAVATLVRYTRLSERSVRYALHALRELGLITPADPTIVAAYVQRADRRPAGWDLAIHITPATIRNPVHNAIPESGCGVQPLHPAPSHGVQTTPDGVQTATSRGASTAPEPFQNHPENRPAFGPPTVVRARGGRTGHRSTRATAVSQVAPPLLPPLCGRCDARPGDPVSARIIWLDSDRLRSEPCPRCHPHVRPDEPSLPTGANP
jgi:Helix-turn-helix domain